MRAVCAAAGVAAAGLAAATPAAADFATTGCGYGYGYGYGYDYGYSAVGGWYGDGYGYGDDLVFGHFPCVPPAPVPPAVAMPPPMPPPPTTMSPPVSPTKPPTKASPPPMPAVPYPPMGDYYGYEDVGGGGYGLPPMSPPEFDFDQDKCICDTSELRAIFGEVSEATPNSYGEAVVQAFVPSDDQHGLLITGEPCECPVSSPPVASSPAGKVPVPSPPPTPTQTVVTTVAFGSKEDLAAFDINKALADAVADQMAKLGDGANVKGTAEIVVTAVYSKPDSITCEDFEDGYATASVIPAEKVDGGCDARRRLGRSMLEASESSEITIKVKVDADEKDLAILAAGLNVTDLSAELGVPITQIGEISIELVLTFEIIAMDAGLNLDDLDLAGGILGAIEAVADAAGISVDVETTVEDDDETPAPADETPASSPPPPASTVETPASSPPPPPPAVTEEEDDDGSGELSGGAGAGIAVAVIVVVAVGVFVIVKMRKNAEEEGFDTLGEGGAMQEAASGGRV